MDKLLTIVIPTYDRREQLLRLLMSIEKQNCIDLYTIVISDNCSNYSIEDTISATFNENFINNIKVVHRPFNAGGDYNIGSLYTLCSKGLMWTIGDDDELREGSINKVVNNYKNHPKIAFFKYSMQESCAPEKNILLSRTDDLVACYKKHYFVAGDLIFLSNNVYNVDYIKEFFPDCLYYCYCSAPHILPMMHCLISSEKDVMLCKEVVVKYNAPEGEHWNFIKIVTSLSTVLDVNWGNRHTDIKRIFRILSAHFGIGQFLQDCMAIEDKSYRKYIYWKGINTVFDRPKNLQDYFAILMYKLENFTHIKFLSGFYQTLYRKQNEIKTHLKEKAKSDPRTARRVAWMKKYMPKLK